MMATDTTHTLQWGVNESEEKLTDETLNETLADQLMTVKLSPRWQCFSTVTAFSLFF